MVFNPDRGRPMRRSSLLATSAALTFLAVGSAAADPLPQGWFGSIEGGYSFVTGGDSVYVIDRTAYPEIKGNSVQLDDGINGRFGIGYRFRGGWDMAFFISGLNTTEGDQTRVAYGDTPSGFDGLRPPLSVAGPVHLEEDAYEYTHANGEVDLLSIMIDFEAGYDVGVGGDASLRLFGGLRAGLIKHETRMHYGYDFADLGEPPLFRVERTSSFTGAGPRLGFDGTVGLGGGFELFGGLNGAVLYGNLSRDMDTLGYGNFTSREEDDGRFVYQAGGELGVGYRLTDMGVLGTIQIGYRTDWTFNGVDGSSGSGVVDAPLDGPSYGDDGETVGTHGPFLRLKFQF